MGHMHRGTRLRHRPRHMQRHMHRHRGRRLRLRPRHKGRLRRRHRQGHGHMHRRLRLRHRLRLWELGRMSALCAGSVGVDARVRMGGETAGNGV